MFRLFFLLTYNFLRIACMKLLHGSRFMVHPLQRISPHCSLKLFEKGQMRIERNCEFAHGCDFEVHGAGSLEIGDGTYFNRYCMISAHDSVKVGKGCFFGPGVKIFDNNHKFSKENGVSTELSTAPITIGDHCWIASNVIILKGTTIGNNCIIGAGCIVQGEIPDGKLVKCKQEQEVINL